MKAPTLLGAMTPFPHHVRPDAPLAAARAMMAEHGIRHLPVVDEQGAVVGIISDRDLLLAERWHTGSEMLRVEVAYTREAYVVDAHAPLREVVERMGKDGIGSAIVTREGRLAGIFTTVDVCEVLAELLPPLTGPDEVA